VGWQGAVTSRIVWCIHLTLTSAGFWEKGRRSDGPGTMDYVRLVLVLAVVWGCCGGLEGTVTIRTDVEYVLDDSRSGVTTTICHALFGPAADEYVMMVPHPPAAFWHDRCPADLIANAVTPTPHPLPLTLTLGLQAWAAIEEAPILYDVPAVPTLRPLVAGNVSVTLYPRPSTALHRVCFYADHVVNITAGDAQFLSGERWRGAAKHVRLSVSWPAAGPSRTECTVAGGTGDRRRNQGRVCCDGGPGGACTCRVPRLAGDPPPPECADVVVVSGDDLCDRTTPPTQPRRRLPGPVRVHVPLPLPQACAAPGFLILTFWEVTPPTMVDHIAAWVYSVVLGLAVLGMRVFCCYSMFRIGRIVQRNF